MQIRLDDLRGPEIAALLQEHLRDMHATSPRESVHALDLDARHGEIKSMRTSNDYRRKGVASQLLQHIIDETARRGCHRLSLETGSMALCAGTHAV